MIVEAIGAIVADISNTIGGPYVDAVIHGKGEPVYDDGGSIVTPGTPTRIPCQAQAEQPTQSMRISDGFVDGDIRILVLAGGLSGPITTDHRIQLLSGSAAGYWLVQSVSRDPFGIYYDLRGRAA